MVAFLIPEIKSSKYKLSLVFAGAYLFAVTVIHILPELFTNNTQLNPAYVGTFVLAGFFLQQVLEYLTTGVEHGHVHLPNEKHDHSRLSPVFVLTALCIHAFLEGGLLAHPGTIHAHHDSNALLFGIVLHKAPAAFALMSILLCQLKKKAGGGCFPGYFRAGFPLGLADQ